MKKTSILSTTQETDTTGENKKPAPRPKFYELSSTEPTDTTIPDRPDNKKPIPKPR